MAKKVKALVKLQIEGGKATPAPPVGPMLAQHGINMQQFCQEFNDKTQEMTGSTIPVEITVYENGTYSFILKSPPASELLRKKAGIEKGSGKPNKKKVAKLTRADLEEVAKEKMKDLNATDIKQATKIIEGTARSMGIEVKD